MLSYFTTAIHYFLLLTSCYREADLQRETNELRLQVLKIT